MYFDRFDICEAYWLAAHDWGMYGVITRLENMGFKPSPVLNWYSLTENGQAIRESLEARLTAMGDRVPVWDRRIGE